MKQKSRMDSTISELERQEYARFGVGHIFKIGETVTINGSRTGAEWSGRLIEEYHGKSGVITDILRIDALGGPRERPFLVKIEGKDVWWLSKIEIDEVK